MKVLIDTNVVLDVLCNRQEFVEDSGTVWKLCEISKISGYLSALSIPNLVYIMRKELDSQRIRDILEQITLIFSIADLKAEDLKKAANLEFDDYEDALQSGCAARIKADYIVTRNVKDFTDSEIPVVTPGEFLNRL